jgi:hypothetical protein
MASPASPWVALYTPTCLVTGQIDPLGRRLSDHLNDRVTGFVPVHNVTYYDLLSDDATRSKSVVLTLRKEAVHLVVPEDAPDPLRPRLKTDAVPLVLGFSVYQVRGRFHRQPGDSTQLVELFGNAATRTFFAVSDAEIHYLPNARFDVSVPLLLVNTKQLEFWSLEGDD